MKRLKDVISTDTLNVEELMSIKGAAESGLNAGCETIACKTGACKTGSCFLNTCITLACETLMDTSVRVG